MNLELLTVKFNICLVPDLSHVDTSAPFLFTAKTDTEYSIVCPMSSTPANAQAVESGWRAFRIAGVLDFSLVGILAGIADCLAQENISLFVLSTFQTDYVLVKEEALHASIDALKRSGYQID